VPAKKPSQGSKEEEEEEEEEEAAGQVVRQG